MLEKSPEDILNLLKADDQETVKQLFYQLYPFLCQTIFRIVQDKAVAEDLAQDTFFKFWDKRNEINVQSSIKAYIRRMAINEALYYLRKNKKFQKDESDPAEQGATTETVEEQFLQQELQDKIGSAIQTLPPRCQEIFRLSRFEDMSYKEIAYQLEISVKTVENQMGKALKLLRVALKEYLHTFLF